MTTFHLPVDPALLVSGNRRVHWSERARLARHWRHLGYITAHQHRILGYRTYARAHITVTFTFPTRHRRDVGNLTTHVVKPLVDGIVDAGLLPDDDDAHLVGPDLRRDPTPGPHAIRIDIEDLT